MNIDPIMKEVHKVRQEISQRFGGDLESYSKSLQRTFPGFRMARLKPEMSRRTKWNPGC